MARAKRQRITAALLGLSLAAVSPATLSAPALAAENVVFVTGAFRRSISVADMQYLADTGRARGLLVDVLALAKQNPAEIAMLLRAELSLPVVLTSRLLGTRIGEAILARLAKIVYPLKASQVGIPALRAGVINGLVAGKGRISAIGFLQAYPTDEMEVNIPALLAVMSKASSISGLVKFFSESPLDGMRGQDSGSKNP